MLQMKRATPGDREDIVRLWQAEFGDEEGFIDEFCAWCGWEQIFLLWEDGEARAMTAAPLMELTMPGGGTARAGYIYAHTTLKEFRGKGFGKMLLNYADFCLQNQNADCAVLVPAEESLFNYFARSGYRKGFALWEGAAEVSETPADGCALRTASPEEYRAVREERLAKIPHVATPLPMLEQQKKLCAAWGCDLYALELPTGIGCATAERHEDGSVYLRELLVPAGEEQNAIALLKQGLETPSLTFRRPCGADERENAAVRPFGAVKWYRAEQAEKWDGLEWGYFGLALD